MKKIFYALVLVGFFALINACEEDEGNLPKISFKTDSGYIYLSDTIAAGTTIKIGFDAEKTETFDVLKKFTITRSINGNSSISVLNKDLGNSEEDKFSYDYTTTMDTISGQSNKYTFTIKNRDGLVNQVSLTLVVQ